MIPLIAHSVRLVFDGGVDPDLSRGQSAGPFILGQVLFLVSVGASFILVRRKVRASGMFATHLLANCSLSDLRTHRIHTDGL